MRRDAMNQQGHSHQNNSPKRQTGGELGRVNNRWDREWSPYFPTQTTKQQTKRQTQPDIALEEVLKNTRNHPTRSVPHRHEQGEDYKKPCYHMPPWSASSVERSVTQQLAQLPLPHMLELSQHGGRNFPTRVLFSCVDRDETTATDELRAPSYTQHSLCSAAGTMRYKTTNKSARLKTGCFLFTNQC